MDINKQKANFLASFFLSSKRCLKPIYGLKSYHISIIRYLCDSIDKSYNKTKKLQTRIYQSQIAKYTFLSRKTVNESIQHLIKKRLLKYTGKNLISIGKILNTCNPRLQTIDVSPTVTDHRCVTHGYTSNSSNITNRGKDFFSKQDKNPEKQKSKDKKIINYTNEIDHSWRSKPLTEHKKEKGIKNIQEIMKNLKILKKN